MNRLLKLSKLINKPELSQSINNIDNNLTTTELNKIIENPNITCIQGNYTNDDINELLKEFNIIDNIKDLKIGNEIRYYTFIIKNNIEYKIFRLGGTIYEIDLENKNMVIGNGNFTWKIKFNKNIFYKKIDMYQIKKYYESEIDNIESEKQEITSEYQQIKNNYGKLKKNQQLLMEKAQELINNVKELQTNNEQLDTENKYLKKIIKKKLSKL